MDKELSADHRNQQTGNLMHRASDKNVNHEMTEKLTDVKEMIDQHTKEVHSTISKSTRQTIHFLQNVLKAKEKNDKNKIIHSNESDEKPTNTKSNPTLLTLIELWRQLQPPKTRKRNTPVATPDSGEIINSEINGKPRAQNSTDSNESAGELNKQQQQVC